MREICNALVLGIKDYFAKNNNSKAVIGLSGGVDSSVAAYLVVKALGKEAVTGILMPDHVTSQQSIDDAKIIAKNLDIKHETVSIDAANELAATISEQMRLEEDLTAIANTKARTRMAVLYYIANHQNALVIGTSDKSEIALGYTTKFGDSAADIWVLGDLFKSQVIDVGKFIGVPQRILDKKPSAELIEGVDAAAELGAPYDVLDPILQLIMEEDASKEEIVSKGYNTKLVDSILTRLRINEHKRRMPMIMRISKRSFHGLEWRMPISNKFKE